MTLLREVMERPLDPGYAVAAARRATGVQTSRRALALTLALALVSGAVTARSVAELRRPQPAAQEARAALEAQLRRRTAQLDAQQRELDRVRAQVAALQARTFTGPGAGLAERSRLLRLVAGQTPVTGPGLQITLADAPSASGANPGGDPRQASAANQGRVLDRDLQTVVNGVWAAGAEAVAVNGRRLTARSAIRFAGQAILVDFRPLVPPYVVSAVGDAAGLATRFAAGPAGAYVQALRDNYGVRAAIVTSADLELPGASGSATTFGHARVTGPGAARTPPPSSTPAGGSGSVPPTPEVSP